MWYNSYLNKIRRILKKHKSMPCWLWSCIPPIIFSRMEFFSDFLLCCWNDVFCKVADFIFSWRMALVSSITRFSSTWCLCIYYYLSSGMTPLMSRFRPTSNDLYFVTRLACSGSYSWWGLSCLSISTKIGSVYWNSWNSILKLLTKVLTIIFILKFVFCVCVK